MPLVAGQLLTHYEILGPIGAGGMGEVYRAHDTRLHRDVAIKVLPSELADDEERLRRFDREARTLAALTHPNIAGIHGIDQVDDVCFLALELVEGEDLADRIARGRMSVAEVASLGKQIAEGLRAAHEAGVVHRDLKPANVRLTRDGSAKLLDFGLARTSDGSETSASDVVTTQPGVVLGTPSYMAPEQARGGVVDRRADLWAFGCVLFECLSGRMAFPGRTTSDVIAALLEREPDWSALPRDVPPALRELLERCLRKDPRRRLQDAGEAWIRLDELDDDTLAPAPSREWPRAMLAWSLAATTLVASAIAIWFATRDNGSAHHRIKVVNPMTNTKAWNASVSWSPAGDFIVYCEVTSAGLDILRRPATGGVADLLVSTPGDDVAPRIAPDGSRMAYVTSSELGSPVRLVSLRGDDRTTRVVETGIARLDLNSQLDCLGDRPWYADGEHLLVSILGANGRAAIHRVNINTKEAEQLTHPGAGESDFSASLSFEYDRIVFHRAARGGATLWMMPVEGGAAQELTDTTTASFNPAFRPGGSQVIFRRSSRVGSYDLWELDLERDSYAKLTAETRRVWSHSVSRDDHIAYTSSDHDTFVYSVPRHGEPILQRLNANTGDNFGARPSPKGDAFVYHSTQTGEVELWVHDLSGGPEIQITDNTVADMFADWSPDGDKLVFVSDEDGPFKTFLLDLASDTRTPLGDQPLSAHWSNIINASIFARWSPAREDQRIAFIVSGDDYALWTIRPDGTDSERVLANVYGFDWYLDSRRGIATRLGEDGQTELVAIHLANGDERVLWRNPHTEVEVAPDGTAVSFCSGAGHLTMDLFVLELEPPDDPEGLPTATGDPVRRTNGDGRWHTHNGGWMPDSQSLVFTRDEDFGDAFELVLAD